VTSNGTSKPRRPMSSRNARYAAAAISGTSPARGCGLKASLGRSSTSTAGPDGGVGSGEAGFAIASAYPQVTDICVTIDLVARGETIEQVRLISEMRGVSERTVWRWFASMRANDSLDLLSRGRGCDACGLPLPDTATIRRRYCSSTCRVHHHRHPEHNRDSP
jgi:hypothetical protein